MCLILFSYRTHPSHRLVLAANRDEYYARPTEPLNFWEDEPNILAGRDLDRRGTWFGVTRTGRLAAITNFRDPDAVIEGAPSRGFLVSDFLACTLSPQAYLERVRPQCNRCNGFNLIIGDDRELLYYSNRKGIIEKIEPGVHGLSNHFLDTAWEKTTKGNRGFDTTTRKFTLAATR